MGSGKFVTGWPDYYAYHPKHGARWIETKAPKGKLRNSQIKRFGEMSKYGDSIWVLEGKDTYHRLFEDSNWRAYI